MAIPSRVQTRDPLREVKLQMEQEKLAQLKAKRGEASDSAKNTKGLSLKQRLKGFAPSREELAQMRSELIERLAVMSLNDRGHLERMLSHRRENECDDIELLEAELVLHYAARAKRERDGRRAYGHCAVTGREFAAHMSKGGS